MHAWSKFTLYLWSFFSLKVHQTCLPMLSYRILITKSICQWFLSDMVFNFQTYMVIKYSSFNLFNYKKNSNFPVSIYLVIYLWLSMSSFFGYFIISCLGGLVLRFQIYYLFDFSNIWFQVCAYLIFLILWMSSFKVTPICQMTYGHIHS